jgi:hypothetical protein
MSTVAENVSSFTDQSKQIFQEGQSRAAALAGNSVQVWPGGAVFSTIQAAINSITNAGPQVQYQVSIGPGTYNEYVTMKDYVFLIGAGSDVTTITAGGQMQFATGVVNSASNCGISEVSIIATGGGWGTCPVGIKLMGSGKFHISGVAITASDSNNPGNNVRGISNNTGSYMGFVIIGSSTINVSGTTSTTPVAIECFGTTPGPNTLSLDIEFCTIACTTGTGYGVSLAVAANATLLDSTIAAPTYALYNSDQMSPITANQCKITGPVSQGVVINP